MCSSTQSLLVTHNLICYTVTVSWSHTRSPGVAQHLRVTPADTTESHALSIASLVVLTLVQPCGPHGGARGPRAAHPALLSTAKGLRTSKGKALPFALREMETGIRAPEKEVGGTWRPREIEGAKDQRNRMESGQRNSEGGERCRGRQRHLER